MQTLLTGALLPAAMQALSAYFTVIAAIPAVNVLPQTITFSAAMLMATALIAAWIYIRHLRKRLQALQRNQLQPGTAQCDGP
jgi:membrane protein implicated in regulation of membrane protease activity